MISGSFALGPNLDDEFMRPLPFEPGQAPFHIKGLMYYGLMKHAQHKVPGGLEAVQEALPNDSLRKFIDEPFMAASWYDIFPILPISATVARLAGEPVSDFLHRRTTRQAEKDISGMYRFLLKLTSAQMLARNLPRVTSQVFDFGDVEIHSAEKGRVRASRTGLPEALAGWYATIAVAYIGRAMELGGVPNVRMTPERPVPDGHRDGVRIVKLPFEMAWG